MSHLFKNPSNTLHYINTLLIPSQDLACPWKLADQHKQPFMTLSLSQPYSSLYVNLDTEVLRLHTSLIYSDISMHFDRELKTPTTAPPPQNTLSTM